jgi:dihydroorotate dehydrogenase
MTSPILRTTLLSLYKFAYQSFARPLIFRLDAQTAHEHALTVMHYFDEHPALLSQIYQRTFSQSPTIVGGVTLPSPLMLAAGFVKGDGFASEEEAFSAVTAGRNIIPGWRSMPALVGAVEFGSFTRYPRIGNSGQVMWRDRATRSTQNRVGLRNPGAKAAAQFLRAKALPSVFGINIAVSPGVSDVEQEGQEVVEAFEVFLRVGVRPTWFTLNISCPNTEDDPGDHQTERRTRSLVRLVISRLESIPLWVKISPNLAHSQYHTLLRVFAEEGVRAVVSTNTQPKPAPENPGVMAGVGGGRLHQNAVDVSALLVHEIARQGYNIDIVGCGGVINAPSYLDFASRGVAAVQYWSGLIYEGPLAAALILNEVIEDAPSTG